MNVDYNKHNIVKYLANNKDKDIWKMSVSSIGFQSTKFLDSYPPKAIHSDTPSIPNEDESWTNSP